MMPRTQLYSPLSYCFHTDIHMPLPSLSLLRTMLVDRLNAIQQTSHAMEDPIPYELIHRVVDEGGNPEDYLAELHRRAQFEHVGMSAKRQGFGQLEQLIRERAGALLPSESGGAADAPAAAGAAAAAAAANGGGGSTAGAPSAKAAGKRARGR